MDALAESVTPTVAAAVAGVLLALYALVRFAKRKAKSVGLLLGDNEFAKGPQSVAYTHVRHSSYPAAVPNTWYHLLDTAELKPGQVRGGSRGPTNVSPYTRGALTSTRPYPPRPPPAHRSSTCVRSTARLRCGARRAASLSYRMRTARISGRTSRSAAR